MATPRNAWLPIPFFLGSQEEIGLFKAALNLEPRANIDHWARFLVVPNAHYIFRMKFQLQLQSERCTLINLTRLGIFLTFSTTALIFAAIVLLVHVRLNSPRVRPR